MYLCVYVCTSTLARLARYTHTLHTTLLNTQSHTRDTALPNRLFNHVHGIPTMLLSTLHPWHHLSSTILSHFPRLHSLFICGAILIPFHEPIPILFICKPIPIHSPYYPISINPQTTITGAKNTPMAPPADTLQACPSVVVFLPQARLAPTYTPPPPPNPHMSANTC